MPTKHVSADQMAIGKKSNGKHWTRSEVESRQKAAEGLKRQTRVVIRMPSWLGADAQKVWRRVRRQLMGLELLDNVDAEMLAIYCDAVANYQRIASRDLMVVREDYSVPVSREDSIKAAQSWARIVAGYADKLGLTPSARARLAKRKADDTVDPFETEFGE